MVRLAILLGLAFYFPTAASAVYGQSRSRVIRTVDSTRVVPARSMPAAAMRNLHLSRTLSWTFGGKQQVGWEIYTPLIAHVIGVEADAGSEEFASALSKWQLDNSLDPTGTLELETLQALIGFWQRQRLGRSSPASEDSLISAPIAMFFDLTRDPGMLQLERRTYVAYQRMFAAAEKDLKDRKELIGKGDPVKENRYLSIVSAYRSPAYQEALRRKAPNAGRVALAKFSAHSTGQALDIYVGGEPVSTKDRNRLLQVQTPAYKWLVKNANRFGFYNYFYEPWHWEYVPTP